MYLWVLLLIISAPILCQDNEDQCPIPSGSEDPDPGSFYLRITELNSPLPDPVNNCSEAADNDTSDTCIDNPKLSCMCGASLRKTQCIVEQGMLATCDTSSRSDSTALKFCKYAFEGLGYTVSMVNTTANVSGLVLYTPDQLQTRMIDLSNNLEIFSAILDRTIVGIYLKDESQRCACRDAYQQWLCATKLELYRVGNTTSSALSCPNQTDCCQISSHVCQSGGNSIQRFRPCLNVCHKVLQVCPYYLPSNFQPVRQNESNESRITFREQIYGGYPAFDCPRADIMRQYCDNCTASRQRNCSTPLKDIPACRPSYAYPTCKCIRNTGAVGTASGLVVVAILTFSTLFIIFEGAV